MKLFSSILGRNEWMLILFLQFLLRFSIASITCSEGSRSIWTASPNGFPCDTNTNTFSCEYKAIDRCEDASITDVEGTTSICAVTHAGADDGICKGASIEFLSSISDDHGMVCEGKSACLNTQILLNSKGKVTCQPGTNPGTDLATAACGGSVDKAKVTFQVIRAGCLQCAGNYSCGANILFKDAGIPGSTYHPVETNFQGSMGSGCTISSPPGPSPTPSKSLQCFSSKNTVEVKGKGIVSMDSVEVGDFVRTGFKSGDFSLVWSMMHVDSSSPSEVEYLQIFSGGSDNLPLEISHDHFLFIGGNTLIRAGDIQVGDTLSGEIVTGVNTIKRREMYAPVTWNGKLLVSGKVVSCYIALFNKEIPSKVQAFASHVVLAPHRLAFSLSSFDKGEGYTEDGFSKNLFLLIKFGIYLFHISTLLQFMWLLVCAPLILGLTALEFMHSYQNMLIMTLTTGVFIILMTKHLSINK